MSNIKHTTELGVTDSTENKVLITVDWEKAEPDSYRGEGTDTISMDEEQAKYLFNKLGNALGSLPENQNSK